MEQEGLLSKEVKDALEKIISQCFINNRYADRCVSLLNTFFVMPIASKYIHHVIAHAYLQDEIGADAIGDYMDNRNSTIIYGQTLLGNQLYATPKDIFDKLLSNQLELEKTIREAINTTREYEDGVTKIFLEDFLEEQISYTGLLLTLVDKAGVYDIENNNRSRMSFDKDFKHFADWERLQVVLGRYIYVYKKH